MWCPLHVQYDGELFQFHWGTQWLRSCSCCHTDILCTPMIRYNQLGNITRRVKWQTWVSKVLLYLMKSLIYSWQNWSPQSNEELLSCTVFSPLVLLCTHLQYEKIDSFSCLKVCKPKHLRVQVENSVNYMYDILHASSTVALPGKQFGLRKLVQACWSRSISIWFFPCHYSLKFWAGSFRIFQFCSVFSSI